MIMEHMHLLERRQDRSFNLIAQWQLILDPKTKLKCRVLGARQGLSDRGWQRFSKGKNTLKPFVLHICKTCKKLSIMQKCNQIGDKKSFLSIFANSLENCLSFVQIRTKRKCP